MINDFSELTLRPVIGQEEFIANQCNNVTSKVELINETIGGYQAGLDAAFVDLQTSIVLSLGLVFASFLIFTYMMFKKQSFTALPLLYGLNASALLLLAQMTYLRFV